MGGQSVETSSDATWDYRDSTIIISGTTFSNDYEFTGRHLGLGQSDAFVLKIKPDGTFLWAHLYGNEDQDDGFGIALGPNKGYVLGDQNFDATYPYTNGHINIDDAWIFLLDSVGNIIKDKVFGSPNTDKVGAVTCSGKVIKVIGVTNGTQFTEGLNSKVNNQFGSGFITTLDYWLLNLPEPLSVLRNKRLIIIPNPSREKVQIIIPVEKENGILTIVDLTGKKIWNSAINQSSVTIIVTEWKVGTYIAEYTNKQGTSLTGKFIINK